MRRPQTRTRQAARTATVSAPVGGWNARDSIADMPQEDAIELINWWPTTKDIRVRKGYTEHVTGLTGQVDSLMPYSAIDGTQALFAAEGTDFFDVTTPGAVGSAVQSGLSNARWESINNTVGATSFLCCFNGVDSPRYWDGSSWITITGVSTPAITGLTPSDITNVSIHKRRMWLTQKNTLSAWYLPIDAVGGAATEFSFAGIALRGGTLVATAEWTIDGGTGLDDYFVAVTSEGDVIGYQGEDPSSSFSIVGVWQLGAPVGKRCFLKYGGELLYLSRDGVIPIARGLASSQVDRTIALSDKIREEVTLATELYNSNFGWQLAQFYEANLLLMNVPVSEGTSQEQYVMNTITGSWARFTGVSANCWALHNSKLYFGGNTIVGLFWDTLADNGANINTKLRQAYSYFKDYGRLKYFTLIRLVLLTNGGLDLKVGMNYDFEDTPPPDLITISGASAGVWDTGTWDNSVWGGNPTVNAEWYSICGEGLAAAIFIETAAKGIELRLVSTDYVYEVGGVI